MENKKLIKFLIRDLSELEELVAGKENNYFDELEMEFLISRISGAKRLIQLVLERGYFEKKESGDSGRSETFQKDEVKKVGTQGNRVAIVPDEMKEIKAAEVREVPDGVKEEVIADFKEVPEVQQEVAEPEKEQAEEVVSTTVRIKIPEPAEEEVLKEEEVKVAKEEKKKPAAKREEPESGKKLGKNIRLGDRFSKEKSVNDLLGHENNNLEQKLSNRPVSSLKSAIGINDRFQYIRELFEGNADNFSTAVSELDAMKDINEAVAYLRDNFHWEKNETSLKFVNLVKRRFADD